MEKYIKTKEYVRSHQKTRKVDVAMLRYRQNKLQKNKKQITSDNQQEKNAQVSATESIEQTGMYTTEKSIQKFNEFRNKRLTKKATQQKKSSSFKSKNDSHKQMKRNPIKQSSQNTIDIKRHLVNQHFKQPLVQQSFTPKQKVLEQAVSFIEKGFEFAKISFTTMNHLVSYAVTMVLILIITLYLGVFSSLADSTVYGSTFSQVSDEVLAYTPIIEKYVAQYGIEEYIPLIQAIMMQESKGLGDDPMDASSFHYYTICPEDIPIYEYSIDVGIHYLKDCIDIAKVASSNDTAQLSLAIQGYDFGTDYIIWALEHFEGYSKTNARLYSEQKMHELGLSSFGNIDYVPQVLQYIGFNFGLFKLEPNFDNLEAWGSNNPYSTKKLYGQCTWFAWGRFYEIYGYEPGFRGDGWNCAKQLVEAHPDKFELSSTPQVGAIFSCIGRNHVGIVIGWDGTNITIQEGNLDGKTNTFFEAKKDWQTKTYNIDTFRRICDGVVFANKK